jgi:hypothetical protein
MKFEVELVNVDGKLAVAVGLESVIPVVTPL